jgi:hypothetical protein
MRPSSVAFFSAATHVAASAAMVLLLRRGLPGFSDEERLAYIAANRGAWTLGWVLWQIAAISLVAFFVVMAMRLRGALAITAAVVAGAGLAIDLTSEALYMGVLPDLAGSEFTALDRALEVLIGYGANGLYTVALALLLAEGWRVLPRASLAFGGPAVVCGLVLAFAALAHDARLELIASALLFPLFTTWIMLVGLWLRKSE